MNINLPKDVNHIIGTIEAHGYEAYAVGGCVRDSFLAKTPMDWDITTSALAEDIIKIFPHTIPTGIKHGTVTVMIEYSPYEVTTYRIDGQYTDNRHPDKVTFTNSLTEDLSRRDFTINAMAYNYKNGLQDPFNGQMDLQQRVVKCVGDANLRFKEDALRMLRAIRFSSQLEFNIEESTFNAIKNNNSLIENVSEERIQVELCKILVSNKPSSGITTLLETNLLKHIIPELIQCVGFDQRNPHHDKDVFCHTMMVLDNTPKELTVRLAALFHDIAKPKCFSLDDNGIGHFYMHHLEGSIMTEIILKRLKFDNHTIQKVCMIIKEHMSGKQPMKSPSIKKLITRVGTDNIEDLFLLQVADAKGGKTSNDISSIIELKEKVHEILDTRLPLTVKDLAINGSDLIGIGFKKGKQIGIILNQLLDMVLENPELNTSEQLLELAKQSL